MWAAGSTRAQQKRVFLSTEDPVTVQYFRNLTAEGWEVTYTNVPRKPDAKINTMRYGRLIGVAEEYLNALLNLQMALECDAWVGDLVSVPEVLHDLHLMHAAAACCAHDKICTQKCSTIGSRHVSQDYAAIVCALGACSHILGSALLYCRPFVPGAAMHFEQNTGR